MAKILFSSRVKLSPEKRSNICMQIDKVSTMSNKLLAFRLAIIFVILLEFLHGSKCPDECECIRMLYGLSVECEGVEGMPGGIPEYIHTLHIWNSQLETLTSKDFEGMLTLNTIHLENVSLHTIHEKTFPKLHNLRNLWLGNNSLSAVPNLANLSKLISLKLVHNRIATIKNDDFAGAPLSYKVLLEHNKIRSVHHEAFPVNFCPILFG